MSLVRKIVNVALRKAPLGLLVVVTSILPLLIFDWRSTNAARPNVNKYSFYNTPAIRLLPVDPVLEKDFPPPTFTKKVKVGKDDTLINLLKREGVALENAHKAVKALSKFYDPRRTKPGQEITLVLTPQTSGPNNNIIQRMVVRPSIYSEITIALIDDQRFRVSKQTFAVKRRLFKANGSIKTSLYEAAIKSGVPKPILMELIRIYSWDVDFQRGIRVGDKFEVLFEKLFTENGKFARFGNVVYGNLILRGENNPLYRYRTSKGIIGYFDNKGKSARKALMRTPINGARLSSGFGKRRHPILGYNKLHRGVDFSAPRGTPVYAAGSGSIVKKGRNGAYGNYIRVRHGSKFETAYAHLSRFKPGIRIGARVRQGAIIGYVGSTGRSTGPHLHYEILKNNTQINPLRLKMPSGKRLAGNELALFFSVRAKLEQQYTAPDTNHK